MISSSKGTSTILFSQETNESDLRIGTFDLKIAAIPFVTCLVFVILQISASPRSDLRIENIPEVRQGRCVCMLWLLGFASNLGRLRPWMAWVYLSEDHLAVIYNDRTSKSIQMVSLIASDKSVSWRTPHVPIRASIISPRPMLRGMMYPNSN